MKSTAELRPRVVTRGRPCKQDAVLLRLRILAKALAEFRRCGYAGSSIDGIARAAGVSRTTIYSLYVDKQTLFTEMVRQSIKVNNVVGSVDFDDRHPVEVLRDMMSMLNRAYYREPTLEILRMCIAEADRFPDLISEFRDMLGATLLGLIGYFDRLQRDALMKPMDSVVAAKLFNMLALGTLTPLFVNQHRLNDDDRNGHLELALQMFVASCLPESAIRPVAASRQDGDRMSG